MFSLSYNELLKEQKISDSIFNNCDNINIVPKYKYSLNLVHFNYKSILRSTGYQVLDRIMSHLVVILNANLSNCWEFLRAFLPNIGVERQKQVEGWIMEKS